MSSYLDEEEQMDAIKSWWQENRWFVGMAAAVILIFSSGWQLWQRHVMLEQREAVRCYMAMVDSEDPKVINTRADALIAKHPKTPFAAVAYLKKAQGYVADKDYENAIKMLKYVAGDPKIPAFQAIAQLRLARVMLTQNKPDYAITLLKDVRNDYYLGWSDWVLGDCYQAKGDMNQAAKHYQAALKILSNNEIAANMISQQLMALPLDTHQGEKHA